MDRWDAGTFIIEGQCQCRKADRSAECATRGWHVVDSSDDQGAAIRSAGDCASKYDRKYRAVERATDRVMAFFYPSIVEILAARGELP